MVMPWCGAAALSTPAMVQPQHCAAQLPRVQQQEAPELQPSCNADVAEGTTLCQHQVDFSRNRAHRLTDTGESQAGKQGGSGDPFCDMYGTCHGLPIAPQIALDQCCPQFVISYFIYNIKNVQVLNSREF